MWMDIEKLLQTLVNFYDIKPDECVDKTLKICLKLDETVWASDKKMERLTLTVMNGALNKNARVQPDVFRREWFKVQSETEIWPCGMFEVSKEDHKTLKRHLQASQLNDTIKRHNAGEKLKVKLQNASGEDYMAEFGVEWHAAGDLKTLKVCNGCQSGPCVKRACLFCIHERLPAKKTPGGVAVRGSWTGGTLKTRDPESFGPAPDRDKQDAAGVYTNDADWDPCFAIPLSRTHICTMHGENRVVEKLVHLHICRVWNNGKLNPARKKRLKAMNKFFAERMRMKLRGKPFEIGHCDRLSGKNSSVPVKPSFNDVKARSLT